MDLLSKVVLPLILQNEKTVPKPTGCADYGLNCAVLFHYPGFFANGNNAKDSFFTLQYCTNQTFMDATFISANSHPVAR
jgi:hypothetical protein